MAADEVEKENNEDYGFLDDYEDDLDEDYVDEDFCFDGEEEIVEEEEDYDDFES